jgi:hypothetical protein
VAELVDELPIEIKQPNGLTEGDLLAMLEKRYSATNPGNGPRYVYARHVRSHAGFFWGQAGNRTADFVALDTWESKLALHGHEVKVSRSDWLTELKHPEKAQEFIPYMHYWWLVVSHRSIVRDGELPDGWGLIAPRGNGLAAVRPARRNADVQPLPLSRMAAFCRAIVRGDPRG